MGQNAFYFDATRCAGCKTCIVACNDCHNLSDDITYRDVYEYQGGSWDGDTPHLFAYFISMSCNHCNKPACQDACTMGAIVKDRSTGLVYIDADKCDGCGNCVTACPYGACILDESAKKAVKCDGCKDRVANGETPYCVASCPMRALEFGPVEDMSQKGARANIAPLPAPDGTGPNLYIKEPKSAEPADSPSEGSRVVNTDELLNAMAGVEA